MLMLPSPVPTLYLLQIIFLCDAAFTRHRRPFLGSPRGRLLGGSHSRVFNGHRGNFGRSVNGGFGRNNQFLHGVPRKIQPHRELGQRIHPRYQEALKSHGYDLRHYTGRGSREWDQHHQALDTSTRRGGFHDLNYRGGLDHKWDRGDGSNHEPRYRESQNHRRGQVESHNTARGLGRGSAEVGYRGNLYNNFFSNPLRNGYWSRYSRYYGPGFFGSRYAGIGFGGAYYPGLGLNPAINGGNRTSFELDAGRDPSIQNLRRNLQQPSLRGSDRYFSGNAGERGNVIGRGRSRNFTRGGGEAGKVAERNRFGNFSLRGQGFIIERGRNLNAVEDIRIEGRGGTGIIEKGRNENLSAKAEEIVTGSNSENLIDGEGEESGRRGKAGLADRGSIENFPVRGGKGAGDSSHPGNFLERAGGAADGKHNSGKPFELERGANRREGGSLVERGRSGNFPERLGESSAERDRFRNFAKEGIETKKIETGSITERGHSGNFAGGTGSVEEKNRLGSLVREERVGIERNRPGSITEGGRGGSTAENDRSKNPVGERGAGMERSRLENVPGREANVAEAHHFESFADVERSRENAVERTQFGNSAREGNLGKTGARGTNENVAGRSEGKAALEGSLGFNGRGYYGGFYDDFMRYSILGGMFSGISDMTMAGSTLGVGAIQSQMIQNSRSEQLTQDIQMQQNTTKKSRSCVATFAYMATNGSPVYRCDCSGEISYQYNRCVAPGG